MVSIHTNRKNKQRSPAVGFAFIAKIAVARQLIGVRVAMRSAYARGRRLVAIPPVPLEELPIGSLEAEFESFSACVVLVESGLWHASREHSLPFFGCSEL